MNNRKTLQKELRWVHGGLARTGAIVSKVGDGPEQTFHVGDAWWEPEGAIHRVSRSASSTESATLLAIYIAPKGAMPADLMMPFGESK